MNDPVLDYERVAELLRALRERTPREITIATMGLGGCFTPELWHALELLAAERTALSLRGLSSPAMGSPQAASIDEIADAK